MDFKEEHTSEYSIVYLWLIITAGDCRLRYRRASETALRLGSFPETEESGLPVHWVSQCKMSNQQNTVQDVKLPKFCGFFFTAAFLLESLNN